MRNLQQPDTTVVIYQWSQIHLGEGVWVRLRPKTRIYLSFIVFTNIYSSLVACLCCKSFELDMMWCKRLLALMMAAPSSALVRFHCSQLVIERLDPLVTPGMAPSPHVHQIVGSYSLGSDMRPPLN